MTIENSTRKKKVLIVDDIPQNVKLMEAILKSAGYDTETAFNGREAIEKSKSCLPDLVLLDIMMPDMDGYETCAFIKDDPVTKNVPIVMVTSLDDKESRLKGLQVKVNDYLTKPVDKTELALRVQNLIKIKEYEDFLLSHNQVLDAKVKKRTEELHTAFQEIEKAHGKIQKGYIETIYRLTLAAEYKDEDTASHIRRICYYCKVISEKMGLPNDFIETLIYASPMHDIGKIGIPDNILLKPGRLTEKEFTIIKTHTEIGGRILKDSVSHYLKAGEMIALSHHERWDGSGYPYGLKGESIPLMGRIMNIIDQYDSLRSKRPYKPEFTHEKACEIIIEGDGRTIPEHFDPAILNAFKKVKDEFNDIFSTYDTMSWNVHERDFQFNNILN